MSSVVQVLSPQAEELQAKRCEMADLRRWFADKELELSTAKAELHLFERRYQNVVGPMYAELDRVKAQILGLASKFYPKAENFREEAESAREQADEFQEEIPSTEKPRKEFNPPFSDPVPTLQTHILVLAQEAANPESIAQAWGAGLVLLGLVFILTLTAWAFRTRMVMESEQ